MGDPMNSFRDPATNVSIHIRTESDDPNWGRGGDSGRPRRAISTGQSAKYSPILRERARRSGQPIPEEAKVQVAGLSQIAPR